VTPPARVRPAAPRDRDAAALVTGHWGAGVARSGVLIDPSECPQLIADRDGAVVGVLTYRIDGEECEVVTFDAEPAGQGTGRVLLDAVVGVAAAAGCTCLWLVTTNDNLRAQRVYQQYGFNLTAVDFGAVDRARTALKPSIPELGEHGIAIRHELRYELRLPP
jgi:ribosomal protein S18 acetylase RimI-like enzyme